MTTVRENQDKWLAALRSGDFQQGRRVLRSVSNEFCCLGVAAEIFKLEGMKVWPNFTNEHFYYDGDSTLAPGYVQEALGIGPCGDVLREGLLQQPVESLVCMNDNGKTFAEIADIFEANREAYTKEGLL